MSADSASSSPPWLLPRAVYVHIPFCAHHCPYCDFAVVAGRDEQMPLYLEALAAELAALGEPQDLDTLFLGGGTPSHLSAAQFQRLLDELRRWFPARPGQEFSVEANPSSVSDAKLAVLAGHGVNRISLGAQSFQSRQLHFLERDHEPGDVARAVELARRHGFRISLDLIFGLPGQTLDDWAGELNEALALAPGHVSTYGLTYEKGTPLWKRRERGDIVPLNEDQELALYEYAMDRLHAAGFEQYEISSFARPGERCRHNQVYWANEAYFGFGLGAARYVQGRREHNTRDLNTYLRRTLAGESAAYQSEILEPTARARETLALNLRRAEGIMRPGFLAQTGFAVGDLAGESLRTCIDLGLLDDDGNRICLTRRGKCVADAVIERVLADCE